MQATLQHAGQSFSLAVHENEELSTMIRASGTFFELEVLEFARVNFPRQHTIVDAGANIGNHAMFYHHFFKPTRLICFEPFPANYKLLEQNVGEFAETHMVALGSSERTTGMYFVHENLGMCNIDDNIPGNTVVKTLDSYEIENVTLLKLDVEDSYPDALAGCMKTIERCSPIIFIEGHFRNIFPALRPFGYVCLGFWKRHNMHCFARLAPG